jgi:hypothetical protein
LYQSRVALEKIGYRRPIEIMRRVSALQKLDQRNSLQVKTGIRL